MSGEPAALALSDGTVYRGSAFGARGTGEGEVVFHTGLTGYQEILTDPSYAGQIVCMTCPEIGNVGVNPEDEESAGVFLRGFIVRDHVDFPSSWRSRGSLDEYLQHHGVPAISGIDTRALVRRLRDSGTMSGVLVHGEGSDETLRRRAASVPSMVGRNLVDEVTCERPYRWTDAGEWTAGKKLPGRRHAIVAYDFGIKRNILRELVQAGFEVTVVSSRTPAAEALALEPAAFFLSNGPGDPAAVDYALPIVRELIGKRPLFGICLGHQILGLALGGRTRKLRFGHHGANQPVHDLRSGRVLISAENHGFALDPDFLENDPDLEISHLNLNDRTVEGLRHLRLPIFSVQYHPEASPGPHDASALFGQFRQMIESGHA